MVLHPAGEELRRLSTFSSKDMANLEAENKKVTSGISLNVFKQRTCAMAQLLVDMCKSLSGATDIVAEKRRFKAPTTQKLEFYRCNNATNTYTTPQ